MTNKSDIITTTIRQLCKTQFTFLQTRSNAAAGDTANDLAGLEALIEQQISEWSDKLGYDDFLPSEIMITGSRRLVERLPITTRNFSLPPEHIDVLLHACPASYFKLCMTRGLNAKNLPLPILTNLDDKPHRTVIRPENRVGYEDLLSSQLLSSFPLENGLGKDAWASIEIFQTNPQRKVAALRQQISHFPDHFSALAFSLSSDPRKRAPLLILLLAGATIPPLDPPKGESRQALQMRYLCEKLNSSHGRMALHAYFGSLEACIKDMQSMLDKYLNAAA